MTKTNYVKAAFKLLGIIGIGIVVLVGIAFFAPAFFYEFYNFIVFILLIVLSLPTGLIFFGTLDSTASLEGKKYKIYIKLGGSVVLVALIPILAHFFTPSQPSVFNFAIQVKPQNSIETFTQGKISFNVGTQNFETPLNPKGIANFEVSSKYINSEITIDLIGISGYRLVEANKKYLLNKYNGKTLVLQIERDESYSYVSGTIVNSNNQPIDSIKVIMDSLFTYTNNNGWFSIKIPNSMQSKTKRVIFTKNDATCIYNEFQTFDKNGIFKFPCK